MKVRASIPTNHSVATQAGYMLLAIGSLLNSLPELNHCNHVRTGDLLIKIGRKLTSSFVE